MRVKYTEVRSRVARVAAAVSSPPAEMPAAAVRALAATRLAYGVTLLASPGALIKLTCAHPADPRARRVARVLGARHCLQAVVAGSTRAPLVHKAAAAVDVLHALSMEGMAVFDRSNRRAEILDGCVASAFAATQLLAIRHATPT